jgi:hypothetical protein
MRKFRYLFYPICHSLSLISKRPYPVLQFVYTAAQHSLFRKTLPMSHKTSNSASFCFVFVVAVLEFVL